MKVTTTFLLIALLQSLYTHVYTHKCMHDEFDHPVLINEDQDTETIETGRVLADQYQPIRIYADYSRQDPSVDPAILTYIKEDLMPTAIKYFQDIIKVIPLTKNLTTPFSSVCDVETPTVFSNEGVAADIAMIVTASSQESAFVAYARACLLTNPTKRPVFGSVTFNLEYFKIDSDAARQQNLQSTIHEMLHVFGISKGLYDSYYDPVNKTTRTGHVRQTQVNGISTYYVDVEPLTTKLRDYFGCPDIPGIFLENEGSIGSAFSHFERRLFFNEMMTASLGEDGSRVSEFTLALLEGTGWYQVDYSYAEPIYWGKNKGCNFYMGPCMSKSPALPKFDEYCSKLTEVGCSPTRKYRAQCGGSSDSHSSDLLSSFNYWGDKTVVADTFSDNCPYFEYQRGQDCENPLQQSSAIVKDELYAVGSRCFTGNIFRSNRRLTKKATYCFKTTCEQQSDNSYVMKVSFENGDVTCSEEGSIEVPGYAGRLDCPDPNAYCKTYGQSFCAKGCSGRGTCVNNQCQCPEGWGGDDCGKRVYVEQCSRCSGNTDEDTACYADGCARMPDPFVFFDSASNANIIKLMKPILGLLMLVILL